MSFLVYLTGINSINLGIRGERDYEIRILPMMEIVGKQKCIIACMRLLENYGASVWSLTSQQTSILIQHPYLLHISGFI